MPSLIVVFNSNLDITVMNGTGESIVVPISVAIHLQLLYLVYPTIMTIFQNMYGLYLYDFLTKNLGKCILYIINSVYSDVINLNVSLDNYIVKLVLGGLL